MSRRFLNQLGEREHVQETFLLGNKQLRQNRNGNLYLQMRLTDRTGTVTGMMWNASDQIARQVDNGDFVAVEGTTQFFNGTMQIIVKRIERAEPGTYEEDDFIHISQESVSELTSTLRTLLGEVRNVYLRSLGECFLDDEAFLRKLQRAPAAVKNHHAYHGGLLEHAVNLMQVARAVAPFYPQVDPELLLYGAFLHDIGKIDELTYERDLGYSDEGQLIGHLVMGVRILDEKIWETSARLQEEFPPELALRLKHMIVSHHGKYEFGSPKIPMTLEALALHYLDDLDAKIYSCHQLMDDDTNVDSAWTSFHPNLGRKLFKGSDDD